MPCARPSSRATAPGAGHCGVHRSLRRWLAGELPDLRAAILQSAAHHQADRYRKHFETLRHVSMLLFHGLAGSASLRRTHASFSQCPPLVALSGVPLDPDQDWPGVSYPQFAASNTTRSALVLADLIPPLLQRAQRLTPLRDLPKDWRVLDGTYLRLSLDLAGWVPKSQQRVGLQVTYAPAADLPEHLLISKTHINDYVAMDRAILEDAAHLASLAGHTLAFDLGYYSHDRFRQLLEADVHIVTRLHPNASFVVQETLPIQHPLSNVPRGQITILGDQRITLGSPNNRRTRPLGNLRLVTAAVAPRRPVRRPQRRRGAKRHPRYRKPVVYEIVTDRWDLDAAEVVRLYLWRWTIELFFRWLKRTLGLIHLLGYSRGALWASVDLSIWLAIMAGTLWVLLARLAASAAGFARCTISLMHALQWVLASGLPSLSPRATQPELPP
jgi:hypothetical protein